MQHKIYIPLGLSTKSPYFYIIRHKDSGLLYAGCKYEKKTCDSSKFMTVRGYQTSSKVIRKMIDRDTVCAFEIIKIRHFHSKDAVMLHEHKFLCKVNAMHNDKFINKSNGAKTFGCRVWSEESRKKNSETQKGRKLSEDHKRKLSVAWKSRPPITQETREKISIESKKQKWSDARFEKMIGQKRTREQCNRMSLAQQQLALIPNSEETRKKKSVWRIGKKLWNNGVSTKYSEVCPGDNWHRGRIML